MEKKYKILKENFIFYNEIKQYRIQAIRDIVNMNGTIIVKNGDLGGYIHGESNLSHEGCAWVADNAIVCDKAKVSDAAWIGGNAKIAHNAIVNGNARVLDDAWVGGYSKIHGNAIIRGNAVISGRATVSEEAEVYGNAVVSDNADIYGSAEVYDHAQVYENAAVCDCAKIHGHAHIYGDSIIINIGECHYDDISGNSIISE